MTPQKNKGKGGRRIRDQREMIRTKRDNKHIHSRRRKCTQKRVCKPVHSPNSRDQRDMNCTRGFISKRTNGKGSQELAGNDVEKKVHRHILLRILRSMK